ncbi:MAG: MarR family transcriptional regulator [Proteobacteria bacterium]|jgi:Transcriptional regulators|nr:MAG: MarR family transcriptional regulator [Pseudomonadota bacterium]
MSRTQEISLMGSALHLLHRAGQRADELFTATMGENELTPRQFAVLKAVATMENPSQTALVQYTGIDRSTIADIVRRLIKKGLLQRRRTSHDARMYAVKLTPAGREILEAAEPAAKTTEEQLLSVLPTQQRTAMLEALSTIVAKLEAPNGQPAPEPAATTKRRSARGRR